MWTNTNVCNRFTSNSHSLEITWRTIKRWISKSTVAYPKIRILLREKKRYPYLKVITKQTKPGKKKKKNSLVPWHKKMQRLSIIRESKRLPGEVGKQEEMIKRHEVNTPWQIWFSEVCTLVKICKTVYFTYKLLITWKLYPYKALKTGSRKKTQQKAHVPLFTENRLRNPVLTPAPFSLCPLEGQSCLSSSKYRELRTSLSIRRSATLAKSHILGIWNLFPFFLPAW